MSLGLKQLQHAVKNALKEEKLMKTFANELKRNLGPTIMVSDDIREIAQAANERIDVIEASGRSLDRDTFKVSTLLEAANSTIPQVRKLVARLLPTKFAVKMVFDPVSSVRCAAAKNAPVSLVHEATKKYPNDDQLNSIMRKKLLQEAGLSKPAITEKEFDMYGTKPLGDSIKGISQHQSDDFPDTWYERVAKKLCKEYGGNLEGNWEEILATNFCSHHYATSKTIIDRDKLLEAIYDCLEERENRVVEESHGAHITAHLSEKTLKSAFMPILEDVYDPVRELLESKVVGNELINKVEELFKIKKATLPPGIKKYRVNEGYNSSTLVPIKGNMINGFNVDSERLLDLYVEAWNKQQLLRGEPYKLSWTPSPMGIDLIGFSLELK